MRHKNAIMKYQQRVNLKKNLQNINYIGMLHSVRTTFTINILLYCYLCIVTAFFTIGTTLQYNKQKKVIGRFSSKLLSIQIRR